MKNERKFRNPQFLFPMIILFTVVLVIGVAVFRPNGKTYIAEQTAKPGFASASWVTLTEEEFYENLSVAMRVEFQYPPTYYNVTVPESDFMMPFAVYEIWAGDIVASSRYLEPIEAGKIYKVHSFPSAFTDRDVRPENDSFLLLLSDQRDSADFVPNPEFTDTYYDDYFEQFGYAVITPSCSIIPTEGYQVKSDLLPEYLRGAGEYTDLDELQEIIIAGRQKYGMNGE